MVIENESTKVGVRSEKLSMDQVMTWLADPRHGAQSVFVGVVRNHNQGKPVVGVSYDAFSPLTEKIFVKICDEARARWGEDLKLLILHRVGRLEVGEASVIIATGARHRDEAYRASRYLIEELKHRSPIWKQEHYIDGDSDWLQGHALCSHGHESHGHEQRHG